MSDEKVTVLKEIRAEEQAMVLNELDMRRRERVAALDAAIAALGGVVEYEFEVWQNDEMQAGGNASTLAVVQAEANHYAAMYGQDAAVELKFYERRALPAPPSKEG